MMRRAAIVSCALVAMCFFTATGCRKEKQTAHTGPLQVGAILPQTGAGAALGMSHAALKLGNDPRGS